MSRGIGLGIAAWGLVCSLACGGLPAPPALLPPSAEVQSQMNGWVSEGQLPDDVDCETDAEPLRHLAADGPLAAEALEAMVPCGDDELAAWRLADPDALVAGAALRLAEASMDGVAPDPDGPLFAGLAASLAHDEGAVRFEAVEVLDTVPWTTSGPLEQAMLGAAADTWPPVVSETLRRATDRSAGLQMPDAWAATARYALLAHLDPGIRGRAALLLARLRPEAVTTRQLLRRALHDDHPYVRAVAALALAEAGDRAAIHVLIADLDDEDRTVGTETTWTMLPWTDTTGEERTLVHEGSYFPRVDDAWLRAIAQLSEGMDEPYAMREINLRYLDLDMTSSRRDAVGWYEAHRDELPPLD